MRSLTLPSGRKVVISDTVGFISDLPTQLVAAFHATLEEVLEADVIVHVRDIASPDSEGQKQDVEKVMAGLGLEEARLVEALNKMDLLDGDAREAVENRIARETDVIALSALDGAGCDGLLAAIDQRLSENRHLVDLNIDLADGAALAWLYSHGEVLERRDEGMEAHLVVALDTADEARFRSQFQGRDI
jgi:GTP-binding protein HflX